MEKVTYFDLCLLLYAQYNAQNQGKYSLIKYWVNTWLEIDLSQYIEQNKKYVANFHWKPFSFQHLLLTFWNVDNSVIKTHLHTLDLSNVNILATSFKLNNTINYFNSHWLLFFAFPLQRLHIQADVPYLNAAFVIYCLCLYH